MANERGTKRTDPETGKKFYDLNMDPIVSPYTGKSYPRSFFEQLTGKAGPATARKIDDEDEIEDEDEVDDAAPVLVSLEEADAEESGDEIPDDVEDVEVEEDLGDEEDVFLVEDEDADDGLGFDVSDDEDR